MTNPSKGEQHAEHAERSATRQSDKEAVKAPILNKDENALQVKQQAQAAVANFENSP